MVYEEVRFEFIAQRINARFDGCYMADYIGGRLRVRNLDGERVTGALISYVSSYGARFLECYHEGGIVYALFEIL